MKTERKLLTGTLLALCGALLALCIVLAAGWSKAAKTDTALPEVRNSGTAIQWKYSDEADWRDLVALSELRGAAGENGKDGANGKDGKDGVNGENGIDGKNGINGTNGKDGVDGKDGADGKNGKDGIDGINGTDGINGIDGKDGTDGKDGMNAKNIEVQRADLHTVALRGRRVAEPCCDRRHHRPYRTERCRRSKRENTGVPCKRKHPAVALCRR